ncbi:YncE family protein [Streptantibioticus ferralitis]|uniref:YncE family protein n=1 Tax=Streptantibioticus ferralitis TaxID=236510 RepID=A0ABT5YVS3_9ACTN|nr:YncE family protein [Streptantibioticus ferralitis]MDF2255497.1 YncE family protein [Streptantibioticus ferralitis]
MGGATKNNVSTAHLGERFVRHPLTGRNLKELKIADKAAAILERDKDKLKRKAEKKSADGKDRYVAPTGFSLNKGRFGDFPDGEDAAHQRGWRAYMTVGVPLVEERGDIVQPPPDVISKQTYVNRTDPTPTTWSHTVEFSISNTISWSLQGQVQLTFGAKAIASLQQQLQKSMAMNQSQKTTLKNSKDNQGVDVESQSQTTSTTTATSTATGTGELSAQLMLGITASVSGSLTTSFKTSSTLNGEVGSRVDVLATQRRQVRRFDYEFPVSFGGWVALYYPEPVEVKETRPDGPQAQEPKYSQVIAWKLGETGTAAETFDLTDEGKPFMQKGEAEVVSTLAGVHEVFELEKLNFDMKNHPLYKGGGEEQKSSKKAPFELAAGFGTADGLALDLVNQKAYVTDRYNGGKLYKVDLASGGTDWVLEKLGQVNDVALDLPGNKAYVADYSGQRLFTVNLSDRSTSPVTVAKGMYAYGVALDLPGNKAYVTDVESGKLIEFDLNSEPAEKQRTWDVPRAAGVALNGGKAYVGQYDRGGLYEVDLTADGGTPQVVATNLGKTVRVALDGAVNAYVSDSGGKLQEVDVADGEAKGRQRVVADGLGTVCGVGLDRDNGWIYVSNRQGKLLRISGVLPAASAKS